MNKNILIIFVLFLSIMIGGNVEGQKLPNIPGYQISQPIEEGDTILGSINVDTTGLVSINTYSNNSYGGDWLTLSIFNQTGQKVIPDIGGWNSLSTSFTASSTGVYTVRTILSSTYPHGGTRNVTMGSNRPINKITKYKVTEKNINQNQAVYENLYITSGINFLDVWANPSNNIALTVFNQSGNIIYGPSTGLQSNIYFLSTRSEVYTLRAIPTDIKITNITMSSNKPFIPPTSCNVSTIYGYSFNDSNGNKTKDPGEGGLSRIITINGVDICKNTLISSSIQTNSTGGYSFKVDPGTYVISQNFVVSWLPTTDAAYTLRIPKTSTITRKDFGNQKY